MLVLATSNMNNTGREPNTIISLSTVGQMTFGQMASNRSALTTFHSRLVVSLFHFTDAAFALKRPTMNN